LAVLSPVESGACTCEWQIYLQSARLGFEPCEAYARPGCAAAGSSRPRRCRRRSSRLGCHYAVRTGRTGRLAPRAPRTVRIGSTRTSLGRWVAGRVAGRRLGCSAVPGLQGGAWVAARRRWVLGRYAGSCSRYPAHSVPYSVPYAPRTGRALVALTALRYALRYVRCAVRTVRPRLVRVPSTYST
jgi:hypothetical protein